MASIPISRSILTAAATLIALAFLTACQPTEPTKNLSENRPPASQSPARTLHLRQGVPLSDVIRPPQDLQDLVNRVDAIIIGTIASISDTIEKLPPGATQQDYQWAIDRGLPLPYIRTVFYDITIEEVLLDDGNIKSNARLRLSGDHSPIRPQIGERFMFALGQDYDRKSYGITDNWHLVFLDQGPIRNFNGHPPGYPGVTNEASLKDAIKSAIPKRTPLPLDQWPRVQAPETPATSPQPPAEVK